MPWYTRASTMKKIAVALLALAASACNPPKYARYEALNKDFLVSAPWGWQVITDDPGRHFSQTSFIGPFDPDFYLGAPSLTIRWYQRYKVHRMRDGRLELYSDAADFVRQTLRDVYPGSRFVTGVAGPDGKAVEGESVITLKSSGLKAKYFTVLSPTPAPEGAQWGVSEQNGTGKPHVLRRHAYAIVELPSGFYVLCYPATSRGYERYEDRFRALIGSFIPLTDGPGGPKYKIPGPGA
jgi:hypothetical protein